MCTVVHAALQMVVQLLGMRVHVMEEEGCKSLYLWQVTKAGPGDLALPPGLCLLLGETHSDVFHCASKCETYDLFEKVSSQRSCSIFHLQLASLPMGDQLVTTYDTQ